MYENFEFFVTLTSEILKFRGEDEVYVRIFKDSSKNTSEVFSDSKILNFLTEVEVIIFEVFSHPMCSLPLKYLKYFFLYLFCWIVVKL